MPPRHVNTLQFGSASIRISFVCLGFKLKKNQNTLFRKQPFYKKRKRTRKVKICITRFKIFFFNIISDLSDDLIYAGIHCWYSQVKAYRISGRLHKEKNLSQVRTVFGVPPTQRAKQERHLGFRIYDPSRRTCTLLTGFETRVGSLHSANDKQQNWNDVCSVVPGLQAAETSAAISGSGRLTCFGSWSPRL